MFFMPSRLLVLALHPPPAPSLAALPRLPVLAPTQIELLASAAGHASLAAAWAGRGQLVASSALPIATVTQYMKQAQATSKLTRVYFRVLTQYAPGFSWVQVRLFWCLVFGVCVLTDSCFHIAS